MREIRLSGAEGGARFKPWSLPLSFWLRLRRSASLRFGPFQWTLMR